MGLAQIKLAAVGVLIAIVGWQYYSLTSEIKTLQGKVDQLIEVRKELQGMLAIREMEAMHCNNALDKVNEETEKIAADYIDKINELDKFKEERRKIIDGKIYKEVKITGEECTDAKQVLDNIDSNMLNSL